MMMHRHFGLVLLFVAISTTAFAPVPQAHRFTSHTTTTTTSTGSSNGNRRIQISVRPVLAANVVSDDNNNNNNKNSNSNNNNNEYQSNIDSCNAILIQAALTKDEDPDQVFEALSNLEKLMRQKCKEEPDAAQRVLDNLNGSWRLVFTTGTVKSQERFGARINYFPIKAVQSFNSTTGAISNGIYLGDVSLIQFFGDFVFNLKSRKLEFDFDLIRLLGLVEIPLKQGQAAQIGASSGLGSESNVVNIVERERKAFFNWIDATDSIATARGGGGGLALWKRVL